MARLRALLRRRKPACPPKKPQPPRMDNPYRRFYTRTPTLEELARRAREEEKKRQGNP